MNEEENKIEDMKFKDIKIRLEEEAKKIELAKGIDITVSLEDRDEAIRNINENDELTPEQKQEEISKIEEIYDTGMKLVGGNQIDIIRDVINRTNILMSEMYEEINNQVDNLNLDDDTEEKLKQYNENVDAIISFSNSTGISEINAKRIELDILKIKEDSAKYNEFHSTLDKLKISYENLNENIDFLNNLLDEYPNCYNLINDSETFCIYCGNLLENKRNELFVAKKELNITDIESKNYDLANSDQEFVELMLDENIETKKLKTQIETTNNEVKQLKESMRKLDENSVEYNKLEEELDEKLTLYVDLKNEFKDIKDGYLSRKKELDGFNGKYGKEIEEYNKIYDKVNALANKSKIMNRMFNFNKNRKNSVKSNDDRDNIESDVIENNEIDEQNKANEEHSEVVKGEEHQPESLQDESQSEKTNKSKDKKSNSQDKPNNVKTGESIIQNSPKDTNNQLKEVSQTDNAERILDNFFNLSYTNKAMYLDNEDGYSKLSEAVSTLVDNNKDFVIPRKERKNILDVINSQMKISLSEQELNENKGNILNLFNKLSSGESKENEDLLNELFTYNKATKLPFISEALIERKDQVNLAKLIELYRHELIEGNLDEKEMETFERYIVNPLNANIIKQDISGMGFFTRMKEKITGKPNMKIGGNLSSSLKDLSEVKKQIMGGRILSDTMNLSSLVNSEPNMNELNQIIDELENPNKDNIQQDR